MSTAVVVKKNGMVAIGADTMTMFGYSRESKEYVVNHSKLLKVGGSWLACVGHASWCLVLESYFSKMKTAPALSSPLEIFEVARKLHVSLKDDYYLNPKDSDDDPFESSQFTLLIANKAGAFGLYDLRSVQEYTKFYAFGSGCKYAMGAMRATYNFKTSAREIAKAGLEAGCDFDDSSGHPLEIKTIKLRG